MSWISYALFRIFTFPLQFLPYCILNKLGLALGLLIYYAYPRYRKRALSNLALATDLHLTPDEIVKLAKSSMQNLAISTLEYPRLYREKDITKIATCENPELAASLIQQGKGIIFFCGHQANWELLFLEGTSRMPGVAIGRPIKNKPLYDWTLRLREKFGGAMIPPKDAYRASVKALREGKFLGIVGDQGMPDCGYSAPFLGRDAWTSPLPALLSKRTGCPIMVATIRRENSKYIIHYSDPIEFQGDIEAQMKQVLDLFQDSIKANPSQWLWIHNKWKQQPPGRLKKAFRHDSVALVFNSDPEPLSWLPKIRELYPREQLTAFVPHGVTVAAPCEVINYTADPFTDDLRFKLVINFTGHPFKCRTAFNTFNFKHPKELIEHARPSLLP
ncbi:MAG: lysophospholipid acyltransferase family protein [Rhabdochlamydiaceae bacterium]|jgi:KDO2-lipid IV(A) lauroyltransferase